MTKRKPGPKKDGRKKGRSGPRKRKEKRKGVLGV